MLARRETHPEQALPLPDGYLVAPVRLFTYWLAGLAAVDLPTLSDFDAQAFLVMLEEYRAHGGAR